MSVTNVTCEIGGKTIKFETGKLALQAPGAVVATSGDTNVLVTTVANKTVREGIDFFPLTVDVEERMYAAGKIPGGFFRREGRQTEKAILACRLIDRPLRPSFAEGFRCETQIIATVLSVDNENEYDILSLNAASLGLQLAGVPLESPVGAVRMSLINDNWVVQATNTEQEDSIFDMVVAGKLNNSNEIDIVMVEAGAADNAFEKIDAGSVAPSENIVADGIDLSKEYILTLINAQKELVGMNEVPVVEWPLIEDYSAELKSSIDTSYKSKVEEVMAITDRAERSEKQSELETQVIEEFTNEEGDNTKAVKLAFKSLVKSVVRDRVVAGGPRLDGRTPTDIRNISAEINLLPMVHGSSLFLRGETQVLNVTTLGMSRLEQMLDTIDTVTSKRYMHHYNFPPYSTGEAYMMRGPKRREIGHGNLALRALKQVLPPAEDCPYTIRIVSDILESNGSSSMATVCAGTMALMDAGVQINKPVSGIAMGLITEGERFAVLSDILGDEDHLGDMDFKVTGTADGITACQMDIKIKGLRFDIMTQALNQARDGRLHILKHLVDTIATPNDDVKTHAPKMITRRIPNEFIGAIIGPGGKVIQELQKESGCTIVINEDPVTEEGIIEILGTTPEGITMVEAKIDSVTFKPVVGNTYKVKVIKMLDFGAVVEYLDAPGNEVLLHVSELAWERTENVGDVVNMGDTLEVKYFGIDSRTRKEKVSRKALLPRPEKKD